MKRLTMILGVSALLCVLGVAAQVVRSQEKAAANTVQVHMVVTDEAVRDDSELAILRAENIQVKQGKELLKVDHLIPARGENAALQLFILIDDTCEPQGIGNSLSDIKDFINAQPASTVVGVAYMSNTTIQITQNFTADHALAAKSVRLPRGTLSAMDSPYLSLISLLKGWPEQKVRREVLMISDGIDRLRSDRSSDRMSPSSYGRGYRASAMSPSGMATISSDADTASNLSQRYGVIVHGIYAVGVGRLSRNTWDAQMGQSGVAKITSESGGEYFALGTQAPLSFKPYLDRIQKIFDNQYYLVFQAIPKSKDGLQRVNISTEVPGVEIAAADNVWVPAASGASSGKKK